MVERPILTPYAFTTVERVRGYLKREDRIEDDGEDWITLLINSATGLMEARTGRKLAARTHRNTTAIACTVTGTALVGSGFSGLKTLDDALGSTLAQGTRIQSIESNTALTLTKAATTSGAVTVTFGGEPLQVDGRGERIIQIPEWPIAGIADVYSVKYVDSDGVKTALDLTGARVARYSGMLMLASEAAPVGDQNIEIECKAGYRKPSVTDRGDWSAWGDLEQLTCRIAQVAWQDYMGAVGRGGELSMLTLTHRINSLTLPLDIVEGLRQYERLW